MATTFGLGSSFHLILLSVLFLLVSTGQQGDQFEDIFILLISRGSVCIECDHSWSLAGVVVNSLRSIVSAFKLDLTVVEVAMVLIKASSSRSFSHSWPSILIDFN